MLIKVSLPQIADITQASAMQYLKTKDRGKYKWLQISKLLYAFSIL